MQTVVCFYEMDAVMVDNVRLGSKRFFENIFQPRRPGMLVRES